MLRRAAVDEGDADRGDGVGGGEVGAGVGPTVDGSDCAGGFSGGEGW